MTLYAVIDANGLVLEIWESPLESEQRSTKQRRAGW